MTVFSILKQILYIGSFKSYQFFFFFFDLALGCSTVIIKKIVWLYFPSLLYDTRLYCCDCIHRLGGLCPERNTKSRKKSIQHESNFFPPADDELRDNRQTYIRLRDTQSLLCIFFLLLFSFLNYFFFYWDKKRVCSYFYFVIIIFLIEWKSKEKTHEKLMMHKPWNVHTFCDIYSYICKYICMYL